MIPPAWEFILLALLAFRVWRLLAEDDILDGPRRYVLRLGKDWQKEGDAVPDDYREKWALFLTCPACAGFWISGVMYLFWLWLFGDYNTPSDVLVGIGVVFALNVIVIFARRNLDPPED